MQNQVSVESKIMQWVAYGNDLFGLNVNLDYILGLYEHGAKLTEVDEIGYHFGIVTTDFKGNKCYSIVSMLIVPECRNLKNLHKLMKSVEEVAKDLECKSILIGGSIDFKEESLNKFLIRQGYKQSMMKKEI